MAELNLKGRRAIALWTVVVVVGVALSAAAASSRGACGREIVDGNLDGDAHFKAREVIVYESGVFPGDPLIVRLVGQVSAAGWYTVKLPGLRAPDQMRVVGSHVDVTAYFVEEGALNFFALPPSGAPVGDVSVYYIAGAGSWTHHFELDAEAAELALIAKVDWRALTMFRHVDLLLVSGLLHTQDAPDYERGPPAPAAGAGAWGLDFAMSASSPATDGLATSASSTTAPACSTARRVASAAAGKRWWTANQASASAVLTRVRRTSVKAVPSTRAREARERMRRGTALNGGPT